MRSIRRVAPLAATIVLSACFADITSLAGTDGGTPWGTSTGAGSLPDDGADTGDHEPPEAMETDPGTSGATAPAGTAAETGTSATAGDGCGDGVVEDAEVCDGAQLDGETCVTQGFDAGSLGCAADCSGYDVADCVTYAGDCCTANGTPGCDDSACTGAICEADEACCDGQWTESCAAAATMNAACQEVGGSCPACGDDVAEGLEACDGTAVGGEDCSSQGFGGGTLACAVDCSGLDTSQCDDGDCCAENGTPGCRDDSCMAAVCEVLPSCCTAAWNGVCGVLAEYDDACDGAGGSCPQCGNGTVEFGPEVCDGNDLADESCESQGFTGGVLSCDADCESFDTSFCLAYSGDCCSEHGTPGCDDWTCLNEICTADISCCLEDWDADCAEAAMEEPWCQGIGSCPGTTTCGDGAAQGDEVCDGTDFNGLDCADVGYQEGGVLACAGDCGSLVTAGCTPHEGDCCLSDVSPGCDDPGCAAAVCDIQPACCIEAWASPCVDIAMDEPACQGVDSCPD